MENRQTKALQNALARGLYASGSIKGVSPVDLALLAILEDGNCHASHILGKLLKDWELNQIKVRIEKEMAGTASKSKKEPEAMELPEDLLRELDSIRVQADENSEPLLNTAHLLLYILRHKELISSRILETYHVTPGNTAEFVGDMPADEDYYTEMNALRNIRVFRVNPSLPPAATDRNGEGDEDEGEGDEEEDTGFGTGNTVTRTRKAAGLEKYGTDLTKAARAGEIDPVIGRDREIERLVQILGRRKKNNPILIGEAGVGKSAIVEGLALRIASHDVPHSLYGKTVFSLDITSMVAGTKYRGQFEERIKAFLDELRKNKDIILFIDEIHTIVGAGATQGSLDTANILKPALARGELQCIGATTMDEYRENIEHDSALERRFQKIVVEPTSKDETLRILTQIKGHYERHHCVTYTPEAVAACVELTDRYISDRHFPDKAIDVLDEAGSKARLSGTKEPAELRELEEGLARARDRKRRAASAYDYEEAAKARMQESGLSGRLKELRSEWLREQKMNPPVIGEDGIREVVSLMTGIPVQNVSQSEKSRLKGMQEHLEGTVVGQEEAISKVTRSIQRSRAGLKDPNKPIGVFMFVGPTGVGKTLLAKELSKWMFDRPDALIRIDMSEYSEKHNVSRLIGSPPGYVGYNEGGQLTETVRRQPYAVILFDEIEKAHPDVFNIMLQIFDEGHLTDGSGRRVDFRNTVIIMTSNVGSRKAARRVPVIGYGAHETEQLESANSSNGYMDAIEERFAPEFINRIDDIVLFNKLGFEQVKGIVRLELSGLISRAAEQGYTITVTDAACEKLADLGYDPRYGVRSLKRVVLEEIEEPLAHLIVSEDLLPEDSVLIDDSEEGITITRLAEKCTASA